MTSFAESLLLFSGSVFAFVWGLSCFFSSERNSDKRLLSYLLFVSAIWLLSGFYVFGKFHLQQPHYFLWNMPFVYTCGPIFYLLYRRNLLQEDVALSEFLRWHFALPVLACILCLPFYIMPTEEKLSFIQNFSQGKTSYHYVVLLLNLGTKISILSYMQFFIFNNWQTLVKLYRERENSRRFVVLILFLLYADLLLGLCGILVTKFFLIKLSALLLPFNLFFFFILSSKYPDMLEELKEEVKKRYERSKINRLDLTSTIENLTALMQQEKLYQEERLSLQSLADELEITSHQLSQILNEKMGKKFNDFVNEFRIEEAKELLVANSQDTVLSIAYVVGFGSKSSFNKAFRTHTGLTPMAYRKKFLPKRAKL
ncbi:MAG: helix-turn-helix domain-containing protein [Spirochaetota bacterium]